MNKHEKTCGSCTEIFLTNLSFKKYCSDQCREAHKRGIINREPISCKRCGNLTKNPKFCSVSCNIVDQNKELKPSKNIGISHLCKMCLKKIKKSNKKHQTCRDCFSKIFLNKTLKEVSYKKVDANRYARIREHSRRVYRKSDRQKSCIACPFPHHYEVAHIDDIASHSDDTLISVINNIDNLAALCPNCHWCYDKGLIDKETLRKLVVKPNSVTLLFFTD